MSGRPVPTPDERELAQKALDLRITGITWHTIAHQLGYKDESGARKAAMRLLDRTDHKLADEYRATEGARLQQLLNSYWNKAINGDLDAAMYVLRVIDRRAKLFGLDMPTKLAVTGQISDEEFAITATKLMKEISGTPTVIDAAIIENEQEQS